MLGGERDKSTGQDQSKYLALKQKDFFCVLCTVTLCAVHRYVVCCTPGCTPVRCVLYTGTLCAVHRYIVCCTLVCCVLYTWYMCCTLVRCVLYIGTLYAVNWYDVCCTRVRCVLYTDTFYAVHWYFAKLWASSLLVLRSRQCLSREGLRRVFAWVTTILPLCHPVTCKFYAPFGL